MTDVKVDIKTLIQQLRQRDIRLWVDEKGLRYKGPKEALTADLLAQMKANKDLLVAFLNDLSASSSSRSSADLQAIPSYYRYTSCEAYRVPLSLAQQRLWFLYRYQGPSPTYNILMGCELYGALNLAVLQRAINLLQQRHDLLRAHLVDHSEGSNTNDPNMDVWLEISPALGLSIDYIDCRNESVNEKRQSIETLETQIGTTLIDIEKGPLVQIKLLQVADHHYHLYMVMHHIIGDGWSLGIIRNDLNELYRQLILNPALSDEQALQCLPSLSSVYGDYARWQRYPTDALQQQINHQLLRWRELLDTAPPLLELRPERPRPNIIGMQGETVPVSIDLDQLTRLKALAQRSDASLFMVIQAVFLLLLQRHSNQKDLVLGTQVAGRSRRELEQIVGFFINTIPLRHQIELEQPFEGFLQGVKQSTLASFSLQDTPFEQLVQMMQPERSRNVSPLVQVMFLWQNAPMGELAMHDIAVQPLTLKNAAAKFDLTLELSETKKGIEGVFEYNVDLFDVQWMNAFAQHFHCLLKQILEDSNLPLYQYTLLPKSDLVLQAMAQKQDFNQPPVLAIQSLFAHFESQVRKTPHATALGAKGCTYSYQQLHQHVNDMATHIALRLTSLPDVQESQPRIALLLPIGADWIVAMLATLKVGGAYVPLDVDYPVARLRSMLEIAEVDLLISRQDLALNLFDDSNPDLLSTELRPEILCLDRLGEEPVPEFSWYRKSSAGDLAYIIFTSGTTGWPKGVMVEQASVCHLVNCLQDVIYHDLAPSQEASSQGDGSPLRVALMAAPVFDASVQQIFAALLLGHSLWLVETKEKRDPQALQHFLLEHHINVIDCTPSLLSMLVDSQQLAHPSLALRQIIVGGEALPLSLLRRLYHGGANPSLRVTNVYGPTEACVDVSFCHFNGEQVQQEQAYFSDEENVIAALGRPMPGYRLAVVDEYGQPLPDGLVGEIAILGPGLARGYQLHPSADESIACQRFRQDAQGERYYLSGDMGYWDSSQNKRLRIIGRRDDQVKIRGYRIELGDIEHQFRLDDQVKEALVMPVVNGALAGQEVNELVAFVQTSSIQTNSEIEVKLRARVSQTLPAYMSPSRYLFVDQFPLTLNGKVDRQGLLHLLDQHQVTKEQALEEPRTDLEKLMSLVWHKVLNPSQPIGIHDPFFRVGGDSIKALQIAARLREKQYHLAVPALFENPTIAGAALALVPLSKQSLVENSSRYVGPLPLSPIQQRFFGGHDGDYHHFNQTLIVTVNNALNVDCLRQAILAVAGNFECFRIRFHADQDVPSGWRQEVVSQSETVAFYYCQVADEQSLTQHATELQRTMDLSQGPLLKVCYYQLPESRRLLLTAHHLIIDAVSWGIFTGLVERAYQQLSQNQPLDLSLESCPFSRWRQALLSYGGGKAQKDLNYWRHVEAQVASSFIPAGLKNPPTKSGWPTRYRDLSCQKVLLNKGLTEKLLTEANRAFNTEINDLLLTAVGLAFLMCAPKSDQAKWIALTLEGHGRQSVPGSELDSLDLSHAMGWFTCCYPVVLPLGLALNTDSLKWDFAQAIKISKETLHSVPDKGLSYGVLRDLGLTKNQSAVHSLGQIEPWLSFNYLGQVDNSDLDHPLFGRADDCVGPAIDPSACAPYNLEVVGMVQAGQLELDVVFDQQRFETEEIKRYCQQLQSNLVDLIQLACSCEEAELTPADIDYDGFDIEQLDQFMDEFESSSMFDT